MGQGGFRRKVIGGSINFVPKPAPTLDFLSRYQIFLPKGQGVEVQLFQTYKPLLTLRFKCPTAYATRSGAKFLSRLSWQIN
ncbi:hypothetical protein MC7420_3347 [Coleofasciculus chthonoplastes PCC 7420]|uniref:Uncharacterized protein n=1 Tax=Coleofasciculus chthonoplastes PCC 7420 TaxID=118168 RepID=B4VYS0_9CYAN|nr:hypothetical protein MC7420_3347 [Coleofasciculus chthonoplastes PCC 7420]